MSVTGKLNWRSVAFMLLSIAAVAICYIFIPWAKITLAQAHAEKLKAIYSTGLLPCGRQPKPDDLEALIQSYQPEKAMLEIREFPTLANEARILQVTGQRIYSISLQPLYKENRNLPPELNTEARPMIVAADLSPEISQELTSLLAEDIRQAQERERIIVDGVSYIFNAPGVGCASTNSPSSDTRASQLIALYLALQKYAATTDANALKESNRNILAAVRALQVN